MPKKATKKPKITRKQKIAAANSSEYSDGAGCSMSNAIVTIEYLDNPVKSDDDKNQYRVIKLCNGLTALLISTPEDISCQEGGIQPDDTDNVKSDKSDGAQKNKVYEWFDKLINKAKKDSVRASCSLSVSVGSFSDPPNLPCASRLLSSVILSSSKKYSQVNSFANFLEKNEGLLMTTPDHCELTLFSFDLPVIRLHDAIDRFTNCFANPLLKRDAIMKERDIIEKEYEQNDQFFICLDQKERLFNALASSTDSHPGNTLGGKYGPQMFRKTGERLLEEVNKFMKRHYSANRMTVVLQAELSLDILEQCVRKYFSRIPNNELPPVDLSPYSYDQCFDTSAFSMVYEMGSACTSMNRIELNWPMPSPQGLYRSKPHQYISWLIRNEARGSLIKYLRNKDWCIEIDCGIGKTSFEDNTIYSLFSLSLNLTAEGNQNQKKILDAVYSYVNFLKLEGIQKRLYDEIRQIEEARFRFNYDASWNNYHSELCNNMHVYPPVDYLTGSFLYYDYDPKMIKFCLDCMSPEKANLMVYGINKTGLIWSSDDFDSDSEDEEFKEYRKIKTPRDWINDWKKISPLPCFKLPERNIFCADDFTLVPVPKNSPQYPVKIHWDSVYEVWHKLDGKFRKPEGRVNLMYVSELPFESTENAVMLDMFAKVLRQILYDILYPATVVGMKYQIDASYTGLMVQTTGFNQKLLLLVKTICEYIGNCWSFVSEELLDGIRNELLAEYYDNYTSAIILAQDIKYSILLPVYWTNAEKYAVISSIKLEQFRHFVRHYTDRVYVQSLVQGNIGESDALEIVRHCVGVSKCGSLATRPQPGIKVMPRGTRCCRVQNLNPYFDVNCVMNYYQFVEKSMMMAAAINVLVMLVRDPLFAIPRAREKLDEYHVQIARDYSCLIGYSLSVKNLDASSIASIELKIEKYRHSLGKLLKEFAPIELQLVKKVFDKFKRRADLDLNEEICCNWMEITSCDYIFDRHIHEAELIARLDIEDLRKLIIDLTTNCPNNRKLSIQTVGHTEFKGKNFKTNGRTIPLSNEIKLKLLTDSSSEDKETNSDYYITDIASYKRTLKTVSKENGSSVDEITEGVQSSCQL